MPVRLLFKGQDHREAGAADRGCLKEGDLVSVGPVGIAGDLERPPEFFAVEVDDVEFEDAVFFTEPLSEYTISADPNNALIMGPEQTTERRIRRYRFKMDKFPSPLRDQVRFTGRTSLPWSLLLACLEHRLD